MNTHSTLLSYAALAAAAIATLPVSAQTVAAPQLQPVAYASSSSFSERQNPFASEFSDQSANQFADQDIDGSSIASAPNGAIRTFAPQFGGGGGGGYHPGRDGSEVSHFAFEAGGGFTAPVGNAASGGFTTIFGNGTNYGTITYGGNLLIGGGWNFTKRFGLLGEFSYNSNKIPGRTLSEFYNLVNNQNGDVYSSNGILRFGGNVHTFGYTAEPIFYYYQSDKHNVSAYVIGGVGFYHRSINFTIPVLTQDQFGNVFQSSQTLTSFTDNSIGYNGGTGLTIKPFGEYSHAKLFAEVRYVFVNSPRETSSDLAGGTALHTGTEELIPVTFGIRF